MYRKRNYWPSLERLESRRVLAAAINELLWEQSTTSELDGIDGGPSYVSAVVHDLFRLDLDGLTGRLSSAPRGIQSDSLLPVVELPNARGGFERFEVAYSPIYADGFSESFPSIRTYVGRSLDTPATIARMGVTYLGFHASVRSALGNYEIEPYFHSGAGNLYSVYHTAGEFRVGPEQMGERTVLVHPDDDFSELNDQLGLSPSTLGGKSNGDSELATASGLLGNSNALDSGPALRIYRVGISANSGFSQLAGGTVEAVQSSIVTSLNRINAITQNDISVSFELIANNHRLTFLNSSSDPFTPNNVGANLGENINLMNQVIGFDNFDIGHVFASGPGNGVAFLNALGRSFKAGGATSGVPSVRMDEVVAHEIGHQMGSGHTFSGANGACGPNIGRSTAVEPGSGSTLMAYPGLCGVDNIQNRFDAYYHSLSVQRFLIHLDQNVSNVGLRVPTGNLVPDVRAVANSGISIPARTPFKLEAIGRDGNNSQDLTYSWEQFDIGNQKALADGDDGLSPIIRSYPAEQSNTRYVPRLADLSRGISRLSEILPTTNRTLNFRVTVRDNFPGGGAFNTADLRINVVDTGTGFTVSTPAQPDMIWEGLSRQTVEWDMAGTNLLPIAASHVTILMSDDGGLTYPHVLAERVPNNGSASVFLPNVDTNQARFKVRGYENIFFAISSNNFTIDAVPLVVQVSPTTNTFLEDAQPITVAPSSTVTLVERLEGLTMEVLIRSGGQAGDQLSMILGGPVSEVGGRILYNSLDVASVSTSQGRLLLRFNANGNLQILQELIRRVSFVNTTDNPRDISRVVEFVFGGALRQTVNIEVVPVNDLPSIGPASLPNLIEDSTVLAGPTIAQLWDSSFLDPDFGAFLSGVAVVQNPQNASQGSWYYATGGSWATIGAVNDSSNRLVLSRTTRLGFLPAPDFFGLPEPLLVRALDDTYSGSFSSIQTAQRVFYSDFSLSSTSESTVPLSVEVVNVNDPPFATLPFLTIQILQEQPIDRQLPDEYFVDIDSELSWSVTGIAGGSLPTWLAFEPSTRRLTGTPRNRDVGTYSLIMEADDGEFTVSLPLSIIVINANDPPEALRFERLPVPENQTGILIGNLFAIDPDLNELSWTASDTRFTMQGHQVFLNTPLNYEQEQTIPVKFRATDNGLPPLWSELDVVIRVQDVNEFYPDLRADSFTVVSGTAAGTLLKQLQAPDGDVLQSVRFRKVGGDIAAFSLDPNNGQLRLTVDVDANLRDEYKLFVEAYDDGTPQFSTAVQLRVHVVPRNDFPPVIDRNLVLEFAENLPAAFSIGRVIAMDPDGTPLRFEVMEVIGGNLNWVSISVDSGELFATAQHDFDFESSINYAIRTRVTEKLEPFRSDEAIIPIQLLNINDPPTELRPVSILMLRMGAVATDFGVIDADPAVSGYNFATNDPRFEIRDGRLALRPDRWLEASQPGMTTSTVVRVADVEDPASIANLELTINIDFAPAWQNPLMTFDVNRNERVNSQDALLIINELNRTQFRELAIPRRFEQLALPDYDINGDNRITSLDALLIINLLNLPAESEGEQTRAEGEFPDNSSYSNARLSHSNVWWKAFQQLEEERFRRRRNRGL